MAKFLIGILFLCSVIFSAEVANAQHVKRGKYFGPPMKKQINDQFSKNTRQRMHHRGVERVFRLGRHSRQHVYNWNSKQSKRDVHRGFVSNNTHQRFLYRSPYSPRFSRWYGHSFNQHIYPRFQMRSHYIHPTPHIYRPHGPCRTDMYLHPCRIHTFRGRY